MTGAILVAAVLLVWAGAAKAWRPAATARALAAAGLPATPSLVRCLAAAEVAVGVGAVFAGRVFEALMACSYAGFLVFVVVAITRGWPLSSCGCFGGDGVAADAPPTMAHVITDAALCVASVVGAVGGRSPMTALARRPVDGAALAVVAIVVAGLLVLVLSVLPAVTRSPRSPGLRATP
jgi:hypothetical protein